MTRKKLPEGEQSKYEVQNRYAREHGYKAQTEYHRQQQPLDMERWTSDQFHQWAMKMGCVGLNGAPMASMIANYLKCHTSTVYAYWRGHDGKRDVTVPPQAVALCKALLELKRLRGDKP